jgi:hypothetical protein
MVLFSGFALFVFDDGRHSARAFSTPPPAPSSRVSPRAALQFIVETHESGIFFSAPMFLVPLGKAAYNMLSSFVVAPWTSISPSRWSFLSNHHHVCVQSDIVKLQLNEVPIVEVKGVSFAVFAMVTIEAFADNSTTSISIHFHGKSNYPHFHSLSHSHGKLTSSLFYKIFLLRIFLLPHTF